VKIRKATARYEKWLAKRCAIVAADLLRKHTAMASDPFSFLRATFYRWVQRWPEVCSTVTGAPAVLAVGDLHVENFGTWRDLEGRLIWGINDFDEAYPMPYTNDLVRLATSALLAIGENHLRLDEEDACAAILKGYVDALAAGGRPFVLSEEFGWLRTMALSELRDPVRFWQKMDALPTVRGNVPRSVQKILERALPERGLRCRLARRIAGLGSLGRQRFVALAEWRGARIAREAKAELVSACVWAGGGPRLRRVYYQELLDEAVRCPDPFVYLRGRWIVRRLAPDCSRIELTSLPKERDESRLLHAMGWETANVHLASKPAAKAIARDVRKRRADWLHAAGAQMVHDVTADFREWKRVWSRRAQPAAPRRAG